jgi:hypothetical protein
MRGLAIVLMAVLALTGCGGDVDKKTPTTTTQDHHVITGTFTLLGTEGEDFLDLTTGCTGTGGYDDVQAGLQVTISDQAGTVIGNGALGPGVNIADGCQFRFQVDNVPLATFYRLQVGRRGEISYSLDQMKRASWSAALTLGE